MAAGLHNFIDIQTIIVVAFLYEDFIQNMIDIILFLRCLSITSYGVQCAVLMMLVSGMVPLMADWG
jgi:hypothetical protein